MLRTKTQKRLNITIEQETWNRFEKTVPRMERSHFIDHALKVYLSHLKRKALRQRLKEEALASAEEDLKIASEWFALDQEAWDRLK
jgi:metal-responsive CopG/Arc/MetJ family transcriptional regulator